MRTILAKTLTLNLAALALGAVLSPALADGSCQSGMHRSPPSDEESRLVVVNVGRAPLVMDWLDFDGAHKTYATIAPGGRFRVNTFVGHLWELMTPGGDCVKLFRAGPGDEIVRAAD